MGFVFVFLTDDGTKDSKRVISQSHETALTSQAASEHHPLAQPRSPRVPGKGSKFFSLDQRVQLTRWRQNINCVCRGETAETTMVASLGRSPNGNYSLTCLWG